MPKWGKYRSVISMGIIFTVTIVLGMFLSLSFMDMGYQAFEDPESLWIPVMYIILILIFSGVILFLAKKKKLGFIQGLVLFTTGMALMYVFIIPYDYLLGMMFTQSYIYRHYDALSYLLLFMCIGTAGILTYILYKYPEWYVVDTIGIIVGAGICAILGISLGILPLFLLMIALAIYDAISVYKTKHMIDLADAVIEKRLPVVMVVPKSRNYSFRNQKSLKGTLKSKGKREAMFMGLGDIVFPGSLVISAMTFLGDQVVIQGQTYWEPTMASFGVAITTLIGALVGYSILMRYVMKGRPQAGLPLLNSGAILGFAVGYFLIFQDFSLGIF
ncbi:MAG: presenilin family intramembrane aspartyl protease PSH [Thermoplasmata archaeon]|nr:presenilin family intramembrane aspartyl protease PSH [Thermoplasmata archaeon]